MRNENFIKNNVIFALIMLFVGPLLGLVHQESGKKIQPIIFTQNNFVGHSLHNLKDKIQKDISRFKEDNIKNKIIEITKSENLDQLRARTNYLLLNKKLTTSFLKSFSDEEIKSLSETARKTNIKTDQLSKNQKRKIAGQIFIASYQFPMLEEVSYSSLEAFKAPLARVHGHTITIGCLIPLAMCLVLLLLEKLNAAEITNRSLRLVNYLYIPGATLTLVLMLAKGYLYNLHVRQGIIDTEVINANFLWGSAPIRAATFGLIHTATFVGLYIFVVKATVSLNGIPSISDKDIQKKKSRMIFICGLLWLGIGALLAYRGIKMMPEIGSAYFYVSLFLGLILGAAKGKFVLSKSAKRNVKRILNKEKPISYLHTIPIPLFLLIPVMIGLGYAIRSYFGNPSYTSAGIYIGIGAALAASSLAYFIAAGKKN